MDGIGSIDWNTNWRERIRRKKQPPRVFGGCDSASGFKGVRSSASSALISAVASALSAKQTLGAPIRVIPIILIAPAAAIVAAIRGPIIPRYRIRWHKAVRTVPITVHAHFVITRTREHIAITIAIAPRSA